MSFLALKSSYFKNYAVIITNDATSVLASSATLNGVLNNDLYSTVTEMGFVYSLSNSYPTILDTKVTASITTGAFNASASGLSGSSLYYYQAYVTDGDGTRYGGVKTFTTQAGVATATPPTFLTLLGVGQI